MKRRSPPWCLWSAQRGFSLIELLMAMAIMAILVALTGLAVSSLGASRRLTSAGNMTVDMINHARQAARARNTLAMLAVAEDGSDARRILSTYIFTATNGTNGVWKPVERWRVLPEGVAVDLAASSNFFAAPPASAVPLERAGAQVQCQAAVFLPDGRALNTSSLSQVIYLRPENGRTNNYYKIIVNPATGVPIIRRP